MLVILKPEYEPLNPEAYDRLISAEIPDLDKQHYLHSLVIKYMMHDSCETLNKNNVCMRDVVCKNHYPKDYAEHTTHSEDRYPHYRRRKNGPSVRVRHHCLDIDGLSPIVHIFLLL